MSLSQLTVNESLGDGVWKLWRDEPDILPLDYRQRYTGTFTKDGTSIVGDWEICHDGTAWEHDFDLTYRRARRQPWHRPARIGRISLFSDQAGALLEPASLRWRGCRPTVPCC
jgi:hypothetical protein